MSFEIHNSLGEAITLEQLDREAAEFWKVKVDARYHAHPDLKTHYTNSWFDTIGWVISHPEKYTKGWNDVRCTLWTVQAKGLYKLLDNQEKMTEEIEGIRIFLEPYFELIDHWESKGYVPKHIQ